jgi:hypothetical protein
VPGYKLTNHCAGVYSLRSSVAGNADLYIQEAYIQFREREMIKN